MSPLAFTRTLAQATDATQREDWNAAVPLWTTITATNPVNGSYWVSLATAHEHLDHQQQAIDALEHAFALDDDTPSHLAFRIARAHARLNNPATATEWLSEALTLGYHDIDDLRTDETFAALHTDPIFQETIILPDATTNRDEQWQIDLRFAAREIVRRAFDPFYYLPEADFHAQVDSIIERIPTLSDHQIIMEIARLLRQLNDGHARVRPPQERRDLLHAAPISTWLFEEGLFVIATPPAHAALLGAEITHIGTTPIAEALAILDQVLTRDNDNEQWFKACLPQILTETSALHALGLTPAPDALLLTLRTPDGQTLTADIPADPDLTASDLRNALPFPDGWLTLHDQHSEPAPHYLRNATLPFWFDVLPEHRLAYFQFNAVRDTPSDTMESFGKRLFTSINDHDIDRLVIDMRFNGGGNTLREWPLLHQILANQKTNQRGSLYVIIGRGTFSAAQNGVNFLATHTNATFVGEPTGSSPQFFGEVHYFTLPHSKVVMNVSDLHWVGTWPGDYRKWLPPTIYTPPTFAAYRENRDPALEAILSLTERYPSL